MASKKRSATTAASEPVAKKLKLETYLILFEQQNSSSPEKYYAVNVPMAGLTPEHMEEIRKLVGKSDVTALPVELRKVVSKELAAMIYSWVCEDMFEYVKPVPKPIDSDLFFIMGKWDCSFDESFVETPDYIKLDNLMKKALGKEPEVEEEAEEELEAEVPEPEEEEPSSDSDSDSSSSDEEEEEKKKKTVIDLTQDEDC